MSAKQGDLAGNLAGDLAGAEADDQTVFIVIRTFGVDDDVLIDTDYVEAT